MKAYNIQCDRLLSDGWMIQLSSELSRAPEQISRPGFDSRRWYPANVPSTVLAALVENGVYKNPYFGMNLREIPAEPFQKPWWYRTEFELSSQEAAETVLLEFDGINYSADIWLNGSRIAPASEARGAFRRFQFDISKFVSKGDNALSLEVIPPKPGDFSTGFVDWNPPPPDRNMGIFRSVRLRFCRDVSIERPFVRTKLNLETLDEATLIVTTELVNHGKHSVSGILE